MSSSPAMPSSRPSARNRPLGSGVNVIVVGAGIAGLATGWELARRGHRVTVLERSGAAFSNSSGLNAGILRSVVESEVLSELAARGARALTAPDPELSERSLVDPVGVLLLANEDASAEALERMRTSARAVGTVYETVDPTIALRELPHVATRACFALWSEREGTIDLDRLRDGLLAAIGRRAGRVVFGATVTAVETQDGAVRGVHVSPGELLAADAVVLAGGGWADGLARAAGSPLKFEARRRHAAIARPTGVGHDRMGAVADPRWPVVWNHGDSFYSRPARGGLLVCNCDSSAVDPDAHAPDPTALDSLGRAMERHLHPPFDRAPLDSWCGMRTFAADGQFALGADPVVDGLFWTAGLGGHGITCGLAAAAVVADAVEGRPEAALAALSPRRFAPHRS